MQSIQIQQASNHSANFDDSNFWFLRNSATDLCYSAPYNSLFTNMWFFNPHSVSQDRQVHTIFHTKNSSISSTTPLYYVESQETSEAHSLVHHCSIVFIACAFSADLLGLLWGFTEMVDRGGEDYSDCVKLHTTVVLKTSRGDGKGAIHVYLSKSSNRATFWNCKRTSFDTVYSNSSKP
jgi:hypothetical protein